MIEIQTKIYNTVLIYDRLTAVLIMENKTIIFLEERFLLSLILSPYKYYACTHSFYRWEENPKTSKQNGSVKHSEHHENFFINL
jgi:hypothetical protein